MKSRHYKILRNKILKRDLAWLFNQFKKYLLILISSKIGRPLSGPLLGGIILTYRCNSRCLMCDYFKKQARYAQRFGAEMDTRGIKKIIDELVEMGVSGIGITGGEPLLREDLEEVAGYIHAKKIPVSIGTNGLLMDSQRAKRILDTKVDHIQVSLDAPIAEIHDRIRGLAGAYQKTVNGFENIVRERNSGKYDTRLILSMCFNSQNYMYAIDMIEHAKRLGADNLSYIGFESLALESDSSEKNKLLQISPRSLIEAQKVMDELIKIKKKSDFIDNSVAGLNLIKRQIKGEALPIRCFANYSFLYADCFGNIFPCQAYAEMNKPVFNVKDGSIKDFWVSPEYNALRKELSACRKCFFPCHSELSALYSPTFH